MGILRNVNRYVDKSTFIKPAQRAHRLLDQPVLDDMEPLARSPTPTIDVAPSDYNAAFNIKVKSAGYKRGGKVRGDGCCTKGKTKGKFR